MVLIAGCAKGTGETSQKAGGDVEAAPEGAASKKEVGTGAKEAGEGEGAAENIEGPQERDDAPVDEGDSDTYEMASSDGNIGFRIAGLAKQGWSRSVADRGQLVLSGPPGGPLGFTVRDYPTDQRGTDLAKAFETLGHGVPAASSAALKVELGGSQRDAQAFRLGESLATTAYCLVDVPAATEEKGGLWVLFYVGSREGAEPTCDHVLKAKTLAPIAKSFEVVP